MARTVTAKPGVASFHSTSTAPGFLAQKALAKQTAAGAVAATNNFAYRLSNTDRTLAQLLHDRHAILLENALIDSSRPLNLPIPKSLQSQGDPGAYIVQARGPTTPAFRAMLSASGARVISYIPNNAYLVEAPSAIANALAGNPDTQSVLPYEPYYKVQSSLLAMSQTALPPGAVLTLGLFPDNAQQTISKIPQLGAQIVAPDSSPFGPIVRVMPPANWTALAQLPGVQVVERSYHKVNANDLSRVTTGVATNTLVSSNYMNLTGANVVVAVEDTGVDATHPDFSATGTAGGGPSGPTRVTGVTTDVNGHGTFVAGEIAGNGSQSLSPVNVGSVAQGSVSNADFRGKAPLATLFSVNYNNGDSDLQASAASANALISNDSWDYGGDNSYDLAAASYDAATRDALPYVTGSQPMLFVFSAGNDGYGGLGNNGGTGDTIDSPGTAKDVITVGALEQARNITNIVTYADGTSNEAWASITANNYQVADFSSLGNVGIGIEGQFGRFKPDVVAPGTFVVSTRSSEWDTNAYYNPTNYTDNLYTNQFVNAGTLNDYHIYIPPDAVSVEILATPLPNGPTTNVPIYVNDNGQATPSSYDLLETNEVLIPPDAPSAIPNYIGYIQGSILNYAIGDGTSQGFGYDLFTEIAETNNDGNYYQVLEGMNNQLGPYYRYESGTSMAAADVSGVLALMADFFTNTLHEIPSPALMKAMLINGARLSNAELYNLQVQNTVNYEGWGLINLPNSVPTNTFSTATMPSSMYVQDQSTTNALATGDSHTYMLANSPSNSAS
ncbi:MAG: S8 family serine peptidase, partial [Limisphaerales bacterium]